ncbi:MAG: DNA repair protein RecN [Clostridiales bacterium]|nr:DNA repair protein RecN [Clostridiales bacterium]
MLVSLHIENIAVARSIDINFGRGFNVLTGETGAGKSIIIGSIGLLMGNRPDKDLIRSGESKAMVSGVFGNLTERETEALSQNGIAAGDDGLVCLQRDINADGRSQARINGRMVTAAMLRTCASFLINIHGQHDNQALLDEGTHISYLDGWAAPESLKMLSGYGEIYKRAAELKREISSIVTDTRDKLRRAEMLRFQIADIEDAKLRPGEEETLIADEKRILSFEKLQRNARTIRENLYISETSKTASELIREAADALDALSDELPDAAKEAERLRGYMYELEDIAERVSQACDFGDEDPTSALDRIESRLAVIEKLKRKYGPDFSDVLAFRDNARKELEAIDGSDMRLKELRSEQADVMSRLKASAADLSELRSAAAVTLSRRVVGELSYLDMSKVRFTAQVTRSVSGEGVMQYGKDGRDIVTFMVSTNPGEPLKPMAKIASGGELSRIMLALKSVFAGRDGIGAIVYDEIDTGVSGSTAQKIGIKLALTAADTQVICVTHSAQIAALAEKHLLIRKYEKDGRTETLVDELDGNGRIDEISRIMGGIEITDAVKRSARELIESRDSLLLSGRSNDDIQNDE